jgi:hypothetical protein
LLILIVYSMEFGDEFNDFIVDELINSSPSDDEDNFYFDAANIVAEAPLTKPMHRGSIVGHCIVDREILS